MLIAVSGGYLNAKYFQLIYTYFTNELYHEQNIARAPPEMYAFGFLTNASVELAKGSTEKFIKWMNKFQLANQHLLQR